MYDYFLVNQQMRSCAGEPKIINCQSAREASDHLPIVVDLDFAASN